MYNFILNIDSNCMKIKNSLKENVELIKNVVNGDDIIYFSFAVKGVESVLIYPESLSDKVVLGKLVINPLNEYDGDTSIKEIYKKIALPEASKLKDIEKCVQKIMLGDAVLFIDGEDEAIALASKKPTARPVTEPPTSTVLKGPREGFVENLQTNLSLVRQRLKTPNLNFEKFTVGKYSQTTIGVLYVKGIANKDIVNSVKEKILKISLDGVIDSSYIVKSISTRKTSIFKEVGVVEKPDILSAKLLEGRVAIIVDGSPMVLTVPFLFVEDFQSAEDYYINSYRANISRILRFLAVITAVLLPAFFVAAQLFHLQFIPLNFLLTIVGGIKGIPLSPSVEMFVTLFIFEVLNEASVRMPKYVGIAMSVVGALVLGETAVNAGIVSTPTIMIVALSGICLYAVPDLTETLSVLRLLFLIVAGSLGGYGIILLGFAICIYLSSLDSFGVPYLAPYSPLILNDLQDGLTIDFFSKIKLRPKALKSKNKVRKSEEK